MTLASLSSAQRCAPRSAKANRRAVIAFSASKPQAQAHHHNTTTTTTTTTTAHPATSSSPDATPILLAAIATTLLSSSPAFAAEAPELFANKCAGCHLNGGNVLAVGATLFPDDLRKNGVEGSEALYHLIYSGKGKMPGFGGGCAPKGACTFGPRLSDEEVTGLVSYVQDRAAAGWKQ